MSSLTNITEILELAGQGNRDAADQLFSLVYRELKSLAGSKMSREPSNHTLDTTALVHEVWLKLIGTSEIPSFENRHHFFAAAAQAMKRILVDSAKSRARLKRGGDLNRVDLREDDAATQADDELIALADALEQFHQVDSTKAMLVELRYFCGFTNAEIAEQLGISTATAERYWKFSKAWLRSRMNADP